MIVTGLRYNVSYKLDIYIRHICILDIDIFVINSRGILLIYTYFVLFILI